MVIHSLSFSHFVPFLEFFLSRQASLAASRHRISTDWLNDWLMMASLFPFYNFCIFFAAYLFNRLLVFTLTSFLLHLFFTSFHFSFASFFASEWTDPGALGWTQADPDGLELISFAVSSNIYCRGIGLPIGGFKDRIYSAFFCGRHCDMVWSWSREFPILEIG